MFTWDWLVGRLSDDLDRTRRDPVMTCLDFNVISVFMNTLDMYWELQEEIYIEITVTQKIIIICLNCMYYNVIKTAYYITTLSFNTLFLYRNLNNSVDFFYQP